jgi:hypothetical protein
VKVLWLLYGTVEAVLSGVRPATPLEQLAAAQYEQQFQESVPGAINCRGIPAVQRCWVYSPDGQLVMRFVTYWIGDTVIVMRGFGGD